MSEVEVGRRRGGRTARLEQRAAPVPEEKRPVHPGMPGGRFRPLSEREIERIHESVLDALEKIGLSDATPSCVELVTAAGGRLLPNPGGVLIRNSDGFILGAVGISGDKGPIDEIFAIAGIEAAGLVADPGED